MKKRTIIYALILSVMMIFSAFAVGCDNNSVNNDNTPANNNTAEINDNNGGDSGTITETDTATKTVLVAAEKTAILLQNASKYTIEEIYENNVSTSSLIKCDGTKIAVKASVGGLIPDYGDIEEYGYYVATNTDNGVKYYLYTSLGNFYFKSEVTEDAYKMANSAGAYLSAIFPTFTQSKWVQGENADTFTSTISANGTDNNYAVKIADGYIIEIKCEMTAVSVNMVMIYKIYDIGTTTVDLPVNVQEIPAI